jgi:tRNA(Glu) U13 pseudouridine synthase TruD
MKPKCYEITIKTILPEANDPTFDLRTTPWSRKITSKASKMLFRRCGVVSLTLGYGSYGTVVLREHIMLVACNFPVRAKLLSNTSVVFFSAQDVTSFQEESTQ